MTEFLEWISTGSTYAIIVLGVIIFLAIIVALLYVVAFFQGREISFWPPKIGPKKHNKTPEDTKPKNETGESVSDAHPAPQKETNTSKDKSDASRKTFPKVYDFEFLKDEISRKFGKEAGFLVIQYGSSITNPSHAKDEDYIVLVHGNFYHRESKKEDIGHTTSSNTFTSGTTLDIHIRLLDSYLVGLIMGKPYEVSIAIDGKVKDFWQIPEEYWGWLKLLSKNLLVDTFYIRDQLLNDITDIKREYHNAVDQNDYYSCIISAYHYVCDLLKVIALSKFPKNVPALSMYELSKVEFLEKFVPIDQKVFFNDIVAYFKREKQPKNWNVFSYQLDQLVEILEKKNEQIYQ